MAAKKIEPTDNTRKRKRVVPTRAAGAPAVDAVDELFAAAFANRKTEDTEKTGTTGTTNKSGTTNTTSTINTIGTTGTTKEPTSPEKNFTKTPNSVVKIAVAQGLFRGKSKQIYDYLWLESRGSINPTRIIRRSFNKIQKGAGLGSRNTVIAGIAHLESIGLIRRQIAVGESEGNTYEIFTPEEIGLGTTGTTNTTGTTGTTGITGTPQKVDVLVLPNSGTTGTFKSPINIDENADPKTSFKTNTNDDETIAFARFIGTFAAASRKHTGREISRKEADKWAGLAELLILELEVAAARAGGVSSVPAFLTEVLRRQFFTARQKPVAKSEKVKPDTVGKSDSGTYEIKPLDEQGREAALEQLQEFAGDDLLQDFKRWYTPEDWQWLADKLKVN